MRQVTGKFVSHELLTTDPEKSRAFYAGLFPEWLIEPLQGEVSESNDSSSGFQIRLNGNRMGSISLLEDAGRSESCWVGTVAVDDCAAVTSLAERGGGRCVMPMINVPLVGRQSTVSDADACRMNLLEPAGDIGIIDEPVTGECGWNELWARRTNEPRRFYPSVLGWSVADVTAAGEETRTIFRIGNHDVAGLMTIPDEAESESFWLMFLCASDVEERSRRALELGATVQTVPGHRPGRGATVILRDPTGARFGLMRTVYS